MCSLGDSGDGEQEHVRVAGRERREAESHPPAIRFAGVWAAQAEG